MDELVEAYEVLSDDDKRKRYDQYGEKGVDQEHMGDPTDIFSAMEHDLGMA